MSIPSWEGAAGIVATIAVVLLDKAGKLSSRPVVAALLILIFFLLAHPTVTFALSKVNDAPMRYWWSGVAVFVWVLAVWRFGIYVWPTPAHGENVRPGQMAPAALPKAEVPPVPEKPALRERRRETSTVRATTAQQPAISINTNQGIVTQNQSGGSNVVNINPPAKVLASKQQQLPPTGLGKTWETVFSIEATALVSTGDVRLKCSGPALKIGIERINHGQFISGSNGPDPQDPTTVVYELGPESLPPHRQIKLVVFSEKPVWVVSGSIGAEEIVFENEHVSKK